MSSRRASTSFCCSLCGAGMYSSLEMICVGIGVVCGSISAGISASSSSLVKKLMGILPDRSACLSLFRDERSIAPHLARSTEQALTALPIWQ